MHPYGADLTDIALRQQIPDESSAWPHSALKTDDVTDTSSVGARQQVLGIGDVRR
jgi:hypothetical protein